MAGNVGWLYYKYYFRDVLSKSPQYASTNEIILTTPLTPVPPPHAQIKRKEVASGDFCGIRMTTTYPGLLIGSGYTHDTKSDQDDAFKIGFFFDHTTGMPIIPGSSVKGMLRGSFPQRILAKTTKKSLSEEFHSSRESFLKWIAQDKLNVDIGTSVDAIEEEIFHGQRNGKSIPAYERDVFFDAVPNKIVKDNFRQNQQRLFGDDYITPHKHKDRTKSELDPFANPIPIKFLKVMPCIQYEFRVRLFDSKVCKKLTAQMKLNLFRNILLTLGIGAKTHVGYGQFK